MRLVQATNSQSGWKKVQRKNAQCQRVSAQKEDSPGKNGDERRRESSKREPKRGASRQLGKAEQERTERLACSGVCRELDECIKWVGENDGSQPGVNSNYVHPGARIAPVHTVGGMFCTDTLVILSTSGNGPKINEIPRFGESTVQMCQVSSEI